MTSTEVVTRKERCSHCRGEREVEAARCGDAVLLKCVECSFWIRCPQCAHIMSAEDHDCPRKNND